MRIWSVFVALAMLVFVVELAEAQLPEGFPGAAKEHEFLKKFVGQWDVESEGAGAKGKAVMKSTMLGDLWVVNSSEHEFSGMNMKSIQMIGYDTKKKKYIGTWADSMVSYLWHYEGTVNESGNKITLQARGPSMTGDGSMVDYRDAYEFKDENTIIATSSMQDGDGKWQVFMTGTAKRRRDK